MKNKKVEEKKELLKEFIEYISTNSHSILHGNDFSALGEMQVFIEKIGMDDDSRVAAVSLKKEYENKVILVETFIKGFKK